MASERTYDPAGAISKILGAYTKQKRAQEDLKIEVMKERMKRDENFVRDIMKMGIQNQMYQQRMQQRQQTQDAYRQQAEARKAQQTRDTYSWKQDQERTAGRIKSIEERVPLEHTEQLLMRKEKEQGELRGFDKDRLDAVRKKLYGITPDKEASPTYAQAQKEAVGEKVSGAEIPDIVEEDVYGRKAKKHFWSDKKHKVWKPTGQPLSPGARKLSESIKTVDDVKGFFDNIGTHRNKLGDADVSALQAYILNETLPKLSGTQLKHLEELGYIQKKKKGKK